MRTFPSNVTKPVYTLSYTDELGAQHEIEHEFWIDKTAIDWAYAQANDKEGVWTKISLWRGDVEILSPDECWW